MLPELKLVLRINSWSNWRGQVHSQSQNTWHGVKILTT